jgi:hypothetical protein
VRYTYVPKDDELIEAAVDIFGLQENAMMVKGADFTVRLPQLHDQIMVLRGAAFNGAIGFSLCVFAWAASLRREKHGSWLRIALVPVPLLYLIVTLIATIHHFAAREPLDPPYVYGIHLDAADTRRSLVGLEASVAAEGRKSGKGNGRPEYGKQEMRVAEQGRGSTRRDFRDSHDCRGSGMVVDRSALQRTGGLRLRFPVLR